VLEDSVKATVQTLGNSRSELQIVRLEPVDGPKQPVTACPMTELRRHSRLHQPQPWQQSSEEKLQLYLRRLELRYSLEPAPLALVQKSATLIQEVVVALLRGWKIGASSLGDL
jgi:hypothetical protein